MLHRHYIWAAGNTTSPFVAEYAGVQQRDGCRIEEIDRLYDAMVEAPETLATKLDAYATRIAGRQTNKVN